VCRTEYPKAVETALMKHDHRCASEVRVREKGTHDHARACVSLKPDTSPYRRSTIELLQVYYHLT
jgi:hypothetical protein